MFIAIWCLLCNMKSIEISSTLLDCTSLLCVTQTFVPCITLRCTQECYIDIRSGERGADDPLIGWFPHPLWWPLLCYFYGYYGCYTMARFPHPVIPANRELRTKGGISSNKWRYNIIQSLFEMQKGQSYDMHEQTRINFRWSWRQETLNLNQLKQNDRHDRNDCQQFNISTGSQKMH